MGPKEYPTTAPQERAPREVLLAPPASRQSSPHSDPRTYGPPSHEGVRLGAAQRHAHQLRALRPAPAPTYVPLTATCDQCPSGTRGRPARRLHARVRQLLREIYTLSLIHISEPTRLLSISYAVF